MVATDTISLSTKGFTDVLDITDKVTASSSDGMKFSC